MKTNTRLAALALALLLTTAYVGQGHINWINKSQRYTTEQSALAGSRYKGKKGILPPKAQQPAEQVKQQSVL